MWTGSAEAGAGSGGPHSLAGELAGPGSGEAEGSGGDGPQASRQGPRN